ncbi:class B sortase [Clostridium aminobutyricum]|uniref:Class B sortase n=1 Tax=Clostridium aminobutyricum TaxID=33953 RepID=A0A939IGT9_CLOAM|nr:class B sortase [Clostridium aminobutyricum]MBN7773905.1 class B sortase [Clostridium aminobutyricum]
MKLKILSLIFLSLFLISTAYLVYTTMDSYFSDKVKQELSKQIEEDKNGQIKGKMVNGAEILPKFLTIYEENPAFAGWIKIADTMMDYPVMKPAEDNNFYLTHGPDGRKSKYGAIYLDVNSNLLNSNTNWILYGHYFPDGSMFGMLENYKKEDFFKAHPQIQLDTIYEEGTYEIIAVFLSQVYQKDQDIFKYYQYTDIETEEQFDEYVGNIKKIALYETGKTAQYGDSLITLSTCDYWTKNGRLAVVAKKLHENSNEEFDKS